MSGFTFVKLLNTFFRSNELTLIVIFWWLRPITSQVTRSGILTLKDNNGWSSQEGECLLLYFLFLTFQMMRVFYTQDRVLNLHEINNVHWFSFLSNWKFMQGTADTSSISLFIHYFRRLVLDMWMLRMRCKVWRKFDWVLSWSHDLHHICQIDEQYLLDFFHDAQSTSGSIKYCSFVMLCCSVPQLHLQYIALSLSIIKISTFINSC